jgi:hypothetical protein
MFDAWLGFMAEDVSSAPHVRAPSSPARAEARP